MCYRKSNEPRSTPLRERSLSDGYSLAALLAALGVRSAHQDPDNEDLTWDRASRLGLSCGNACCQWVWSQVKRGAATVLCSGLLIFACGCCRLALDPGAGVGDGQGEGFELGDQGAEAAVVVDPLAVAGDLLVGHEPGDGLAGDLAGPLPVGAVQHGRVGVAG